MQSLSKLVGMQEVGRDTSDDKLQREPGKYENKKKNKIILGRKTENMEKLVISPNSGSRDLHEKARQNLV